MFAMQLRGKLTDSYIITGLLNSARVFALTALGLFVKISHKYARKIDIF